jgi:hypothetical protein
MGIEEFSSFSEIQTKGIDNLLDNIIEENFSNLKKGRDIRVQEAFKTPSRPDQKRNTPRHTYSKYTRQRNSKYTKQRILKAAKNNVIGHI